MLPRRGGGGGPPPPPPAAPPPPPRRSTRGSPRDSTSSWQHSATQSTREVKKKKNPQNLDDVEA